jgi:glutaredoxin
MAKTVLKNKGIEFTYKLLDELGEEERKNYISMARLKGMLSMPLIIKDNEMFTLKEVF